ncbi:MAG: DNA repair protein RadA [Thermodesulfobacteriota bacterium]|nr:DNA repair protein RadA [Thermodesulfobacteriota bacterium]
MTKVRTCFSCQSCGYQAPRWLGRCPDCNGWNTLVEEKVNEQSPYSDDPLGIYAPEPPRSITEIDVNGEERISTNIGEFDRVLGGGIVEGAVVLVGGDPGIGKSTLLLQVLNNLGLAEMNVLYVSGEESVKQTKMRGNRLGVSSRNLYLVSETSLEKIMDEVGKLKPQILVIDSIQTIYTSLLQSAPGSISQVRETAARMMHVSKKTGTATFLVGHVTKEGAIAGPRVLEHMVDTVLYFEGDRGHPYRILRAVKNRYGSTNEIGVFEMKDSGLMEVFSPSELFLSERPVNIPGSVVISSVEGSRPILVELQALVTPTGFSVPRRTTIGVDHNRVSLLAAVLEKKVGMNLINQDVFVNVAGGVRIDEPAVDLGIVISVASSYMDKPVDPKTVVFGEVGLGGEVRGIHQGDVRIKESAKLGFTRCVLPERNKKSSQGTMNIELAGVNSVEEALDILLNP